MKGKKLILMALAVVLTLSLAVPAIMAANNVTINGKYEEITVDVVLMQSGEATINPYGMPITVEDAGGSEIGLVKTAGKISSYPLVMYNKTEVPLSVGATVSAENVNGVELVTTNIAASSTDKQAQVYLETKQDWTLGNLDYKLSTDTTTANFIGTVNARKLVAAFNAWEATTYDRTKTSQVIVNPDEPTRQKNMAVMNAGTGIAPNEGSYVLYRLGGNCVEAPDVAWNAGATGGTGADGFDVKIAFTFTPTTDVPRPTPTP